MSGASLHRKVRRTRRRPYVPPALVQLAPAGLGDPHAELILRVALATVIADGRRNSRPGAKARTGFEKVAVRLLNHALDRRREGSPHPETGRSVLLPPVCIAGAGMVRSPLRIAW